MSDAQDKLPVGSLAAQPTENDNFPVEASSAQGGPQVPALAVDQGAVQLGPLSIQAAALVRSIDALSRIFWVSLAGTFLMALFAGLSQLEGNIATDYVLLGEYQIPKSILPLAGVTFAMFVLWLTANRLRMLAHVLETTRLPPSLVDEIFFLNPPVLHVFDRDNVKLWSPFTGVGMLIVIWAVFLGNSIALTISEALQRTASFAEINLVAFVAYLILIGLVIVYGVRAVFRPLQRIISRLHDTQFHIGWPRIVTGVGIMLLVLLTNNLDQVRSPGAQANDLLGPGIANAVDGETLFMQGVEIKLFGIDAMEPNQTCRTAEGADYGCGQAATQALQEWVQQSDVLCNPLFAVNERKVVALCALVQAGSAVPMDDDVFLETFREDNLSRWLVESGHALGVGLGAQLFEEEQNQAQILRVGIWQGSFEPPATWRGRHPTR